ncbi:isocitrate lyase/PEP mutase family protein [Dictyobacter formicarum]|nr:isocitrate lyase/phosphoenolpyruvate mutase family protein [Dictyobacter formicarum]
MDTGIQRERALRFRALHHQAPMLVLPNVWDAASAQVIEQVGFQAIATTSSGVAAALGYEDGQHITREMLVEVLARITRVVNCPVTADIEAGFGNSIAEVLQTVRAVIATGVVGINIEDSRKQPGSGLVDISYQVELLAALRELAAELDIPFVINARVDVFLLKIGEPESRFEQAVQRANAYLQAGADCVYPIAHLEHDTIARLVEAIHGPINIMAGCSGTTLAEFERLGVARVSLAGSLMRSMLAHVRAVAVDILEHGSFEKLNAGL